MVARRLVSALCLGAAAAVFSAPLCRSAAAADPEYAKIVADSSPVLVSIKYVLKIDMNGQGQEREAEAVGVMIDGKGLVLCSGVDMGAIPGGGRPGLTVTPTKIKVLVGDDTEGVEAKLVSRDSELDLAWVQIEKPADKAYPHVDFSKSSAAAQGEKLVMITRLDKFFDRAVAVSDFRVGAVVKKPRALLVPADAIRAYGRPVFSAAGQVVGFAVVAAPSQEEAAEEGAFRGAIVVLPGLEVAAATERALKNPDADKPAETAAVPTEPKAAPDAGAKKP